MDSRDFHLALAPGRIEDRGRWIGNFAAVIADLVPNDVVVLHNHTDGVPRNPDLGYPALGRPAVSRTQARAHAMDHS